MDALSTRVKPKKPNGVYDRAELGYQRGELLLKIERVEDIWQQVKIEAIPETAEERAMLAETKAMADDIIETLQASIKRCDQLLECRMFFDDALDFLVKSFECGDLQGFAGYTDLYRTDSRFDAEKLKKAIPSVGGSLKIVSEVNGYWAYTVKLPLDVLAYVENWESSE
jgi:hypothetical protein